MRALVASSLALVLLAAAMPAEAHPSPAHPFPKTEKAARALVKDVLQDADASGAKLLQAARSLLRTVENATGALPPVPPLPDTTQGSLEVRASLVQPGVKGEDMMLGALWLGASEGFWTGAYWVESDGAGQVLPRLGDFSENGVILFVEGGALADRSSVNVTYHFLGLDGKHIVHPLGEIPLLDAMPVLDRVDVGGAHASQRGEAPEAVLFTPWNLYAHNVTAGVTILAGEETLVDETITACADWEVEAMEPGCRLLYVFEFPAEATALQLWRLDTTGQRVLERELDRAQLLAGVTFAP